MRSNQQNKRSRNRGNNNNNRKSSNPLSRNYESNGPDVRIRGNAATVAEKYMQLARDAHSSGDSVAAENYLQHAEHYNRIISAAQAQFQQQQQARAEQNGSQDQRNDADNGEDDEANTPVSRFDSPRNDEPDRQNNRQDGRRNDGNRQNNSPSSDRKPVANGSSEAPVEGGKDAKPDGPSAGSEPVTAETADAKPKPARRPRRKRVDSDTADAKPSSDKAGTPQPSVGELPAFVTGNGEVSASE